MDDAPEHPLPLLRLAPPRAAQGALVGISTFVVWALVSWLFSRYVSTEGWSWQLTVAGLGAYGLLTVGSMAMLAWTSLAVMASRRLRRVVSAHLVPFWLLFLLALGVGTTTGALAPTDHLVSGWLGSGVGFSVLLSGFVLARGLSHRRPRAAARAVRAARAARAARRSVRRV